MLNKYPAWKYLLIIAVLVFGFIYAAPNLYPPDHAIQISSDGRTATIDERLETLVKTTLDKADIAYLRTELEEQSLLVRVTNPDDQLRAQTELKAAVGSSYVVALNLAPSTPAWLQDLGAEPMKLGLDLSGGVHFLMEVDVDFAVQKRMDSVVGTAKTQLRDENLRGIVKQTADNKIEVAFSKEADRDSARDILGDAFRELTLRSEQRDDGKYLVVMVMSELQARDIQGRAVEQNLITLRNRVNELGVAEPLVQKQGFNRIVVELPGVQDTAEAKRIIGKTANLEFRLEASPDASASDRQQFSFRDGLDSRSSAWLERRVVISGDSVSDAQPGFDENARPQVNITLDSDGGKKMHRSTWKNVGRNLGVLFIERKTEPVYRRNEQGQQEVVSEREYDVKEIISLATIQSALGVQFRITGLDSNQEASDLALLLRAGALAAPIKFVEERTIGPSLGAENIEQGFKSVVIGFLAVLVVMLVIYKVFGIAANIALTLNLVLLIAIMSLFSATLTLPGIAGIVLTVGMAVDANVLIFARIREEMANGTSAHMAINAGYERAVITILDANITTLIAAVILYAIGTGPVKGFAVTLSVGIITSMFTAILCTRAIVNLIYGGRKLEKLHI